MDDNGHARPTPGFVVPLGPILLIVIIFWVIRSRRKSRDERALSRIVNAIDESDIPARAKEMLLQSVDEVRHAMSSLREMASEVRR